MALTINEKNELIQEVINEITTQSTSIDELETISDLSKTESLPAYKTDTSTLVKVPISLISKPAVDAADSANRAASAASSAANAATQAKGETVAATAEAREATKAANDATGRVNQAMDNINAIKTTADNADTLSRRLEEQLNGYKIKTPTEEEYEGLEVKENDTLYFCTETEEV